MSALEDAFAQLKQKPTPDKIRAVFERYRALLGAGDIDGIVALFAPDAVWEEPVGSRPEHGHDAIRARYAEALENCGGKIPMVADGVMRIAGNHAVACSIATAVIGGQKIEIDTANVIALDEDGLITEMKVYVGPGSFRPVAG